MQKKDSNHSDTLKLMASEGLYAENSFYYLVIIVFFVTLGLFTFGFELPNYSLQQNLFFNFIWFLFLAIAMGYASFWYRLLFGTEAKIKIHRERTQRWAEVVKDPIKRQAISKHIADNGCLPSNKLQQKCLIFLGWCALFELFFISSWVKNWALVWQPIWIEWIIEFMTANLNTPPLNIDRKFFTLSLEDSVLSKKFTDEKFFLASPLGDVVLIFQFWRALIFFPILTVLMILTWTSLDTIFNPKNIKGIKDFIRCSLISIFMPLFFISGSLGLLRSVSFTMKFSLSKAMWLESFYLNFMFFFIIFSLKIFVGWFYFWKKIYRKILNRA